MRIGAKHRGVKFTFGIITATLCLCTGCSNPIVWLQQASSASLHTSNRATANARTAGDSATGSIVKSANVAMNLQSTNNSSSTSTIASNNTTSNDKQSVPKDKKTSTSKTALPPSVLIDVPALDQNPELPNGCEVTSLAMLLSYLGHPVNKEKLAREEPTDPTKRVNKPDGTVTYWGNPNVGFVGSPFQKYNGYGIYHGPMAKFLNQILPGEALDLTGKPFSDIIKSVANGTPVVVWDTATFKKTNSWTTWNTPEGKIKVTMQEHAVLLVGYDGKQLFVNNPLNGKKAQPVNKAQFIAAWKQLGEQAITVKPA